MHTGKLIWYTNSKHQDYINLIAISSSEISEISEGEEIFARQEMNLKVIPMELIIQ